MTNFNLLKIRIRRKRKLPAVNIPPPTLRVVPTTLAPLQLSWKSLTSDLRSLSDRWQREMLDRRSFMVDMASALDSAPFSRTFSNWSKVAICKMIYSCWSALNFQMFTFRFLDGKHLKDSEAQWCSGYRGCMVRVKVLVRAPLFAVIFKNWNLKNQVGDFPTAAAGQPMGWPVSNGPLQI